MLVSLLKEHFRYFHENGWIVFENLVKESKIKVLNEALDAFFVKNLKKDALEANFEEQWQLGRNLSFEEPLLRRLACQKNLAYIASELCKIRPLRLGFDQILQTTLIPATSFSLKEISQIRGDQTALLLCLRAFEGLKTSPSILPRQPGSALFVSHEQKLPFSELIHQVGQVPGRYLMLVYAESRSFYTPLSSDSLSSKDWKKRAYAFGDLLAEKDHPLLIS